MSDSYSRRHLEQRRIKDADQAELEAILRGSTIVDQGVYDDRVADALDDYDPGSIDGNRWQQQDLAVDGAVGGVHEEVERRASLLGEAYPFELAGGQLCYRESRSGFYEFCLAISLADQITQGNHVQLPRTFERLAAILVQAYLGSTAKSLHVGSPRDPLTGKTFRKAMRSAQRETREWFWNPQPDLPNEPRDTGDHGVDFIAWKSHKDGRVGSLFILGQCACGDDWTAKFHDVALERYAKWFNPLSFVTPVRAFTTPRHIGDGWLHEALRLAGLVFDRVRLTHLAEAACEGDAYQSWRATVESLTRLVLARPIAA